MFTFADSTVKKYAILLVWRSWHWLLKKNDRKQLSLNLDYSERLSWRYLLISVAYAQFPTDIFLVSLVRKSLEYIKEKGKKK